MATHLAEEPELVAAARQGDHHAFCVLINQYYWNLYNVVLKIARNNEDTEDALQDAFLKAFCNVKQFQGNSRFYTWLVRIAVNEALMKLRKRHSDRQTSLEELAPYGADLPMARTQSWHDDPERRYAQLEAQEILQHALSGISPRLSMAFVLRNVDDLSMRETADALGLSSSAVKSRLVRARSRLKRRLRSVYTPRGAARQTPQSASIA